MGAPGEWGGVRGPGRWLCLCRRAGRGDALPLRGVVVASLTVEVKLSLGQSELGYSWPHLPGEKGRMASRAVITARQERLGTELRKLRERSGLTLREAARALGIAESKLSS